MWHRLSILLHWASMSLNAKEHLRVPSISSSWTVMTKAEISLIITKGSTFSN
jgi:hypothetical protein